MAAWPPGTLRREIDENNNFKLAQTRKYDGKGRKTEETYHFE